MSRNTFVVVFLALASGAAVAGDPPDATLNPQSGQIEITGSVTLFGDDEIRHVVRGPEPAVTFLTGNSIDDLSPKIAVAPNGNTFVVWWADETTDEVLLRRFDYTEQSWSSATVLSDSGDGSRNPAIVHDGTDTWVAFEHDLAGATGIKLGVIVDEPEPFGVFASIASTVYSGDLDLRVHSESGELWVTWVDSSDEVGWCVYDAGSGGWSVADYESYAQDDVPTARGRIRTDVVGN
jgi:hypothetical protein